MHQNESDGATACHMGTRVRKNHTSKRDAFQTIGGPPAFVITEDGITRNLGGECYSEKGFRPKIKLDTRIALVKYHPGYDPGLLDHMVDAGYRGIIFEGTGLGHVGRVMYDSVKRARQKGVFLGMTSQCVDGRVRMTVYDSGRDLLDMGITPLGDMVPEVALVKAMWILGNHGQCDPDTMGRIMLENTASEMGA